MFEEVIEAIANIGFPVVLSMYLLVRIENQIQSLINTIETLANKI